MEKFVNANTYIGNLANTDANKQAIEEINRDYTHSVEEVWGEIKKLRKLTNTPTNVPSLATIKQQNGQKHEIATLNAIAGTFNSLIKNKN